LTDFDCTLQSILEQFAYFSYDEHYGTKTEIYSRLDGDQIGPSKQFYK